MTVSALDIPYAVASTTFPNAPEPRVLPAEEEESDSFKQNVKWKHITETLMHFP